MSDIYTSNEDEQLISRIINDGFKESMPKYYVLRLALAKSLQINNTSNLDYYGNFKKDGKEYLLKQVTGLNSGDGDYDKHTRVLIGYLHDLDLVHDDTKYKQLLQQHIRRGLDEINNSWKSSHSFYEWMYQDLLIDTEPTVSNEDTIGDLEAIYHKKGISLQLIDTKQASRLNHYKVKLNDSNLIKQFENVTKNELLTLLGVRNVSYESVDGEPLTYVLSIPKRENQWHSFDFYNIKKWLYEIPTTYQLGVFLGIDEFDNPYYFDLKESLHLFIAGTTGSGKSVTLHMVILSLMQKSDREIEFILIDPKKVELASYADSDKLSNISNNKILTETDEILQTLEALESEMEERYSYLQSKNVQSVSDLPVGELPNIIVVVEELANLLMGTNNKTNKAMERILGNLAQKARAAGIHLILVTQRPSSEVLPGILRSNIPSRISLKVQKSSESKIILDETGAETLLGKGDCYVKVGPSFKKERVHSLYISNDKVKELI